MLVNVDENRLDTVEALRAFVPQVIVTHPVAQLTRLRAAGADSLFMVGNVGPSAQVVKSLDRMGLQSSLDSIGKVT